MDAEEHVVVFGASESGQLGLADADEEMVARPRTAHGFGTSVISLSCGSWSTATACSSPNEVYISKGRGMPVGRIDGLETTARIVAVACGEDFFIVQTEDGTILSAGGAAYGQLGRGENAKESSTPRVVRGALPKSGITKIAAGSFHWLALSGTGEVYGCGGNRLGQLGLPGRRLVTEPERIYNLWGQPVTAISAGGNHSAVLTALGCIFTFGSGRHGQLGVPLLASDGMPDGAGPRNLSSTVDSGAQQPPATDCTELPQRVPCAEGLHYVDLACGSEHTLALRSDGLIVAFGRGSSGQLGVGSTGSNSLPLVVRTPQEEKFIALAAGGRHSCAISTRGELYAWGGGESGQLGTGDIGDKLYPVKVRGPRTKRGKKRVREPSEPILTNAADEEDATFCEAQSRDSKNSSSNMIVVNISCGLSHTVAIVAHAGTPPEKLEPPWRKRNRLSLPEKFDARYGSVLFRHSGTLVAQFVKRKNGLSVVDVDAAEVEYTEVLRSGGDSVGLPNAALDLSQEVDEAFEKMGAVDGSNFRSGIVMFPEPAFALLLAMMNPVLSLDWCRTSLGRFAKVARSLRIGGKRSFIDALSTYFPSHIVVTRLVRPLQSLITNDLLMNRVITDTVVNAVKTLFLIFSASEWKGARNRLVPLKEFYNSTITHEVNLAIDYERCYGYASFRTGKSKPFTFLSYPFILDEEAKSGLLKKEMRFLQNEMAMGSLWAPHCVITVRRDHIIQDALAQLNRHPLDLRKPLKVQFAGEEGEDAGGLRKEFFQIAIEKLFSVDFGMFTYDEATRFHWFRGDSLEPNGAFYLVGTLVGLAIYNDTILDLHFPPVVYKKLQGLPTDLEDLRTLSPFVGQSLQALLDYEGDDVEDVFCLTHTVSFTSIFGEKVDHELVEGGKEKMVTAQNKAQFVRMYVEWYLETSIQSFFVAFKEGFQNMIPGRMLGLFAPEELEVLICGERFHDVTLLEKFTVYEGGYDKSSPVISWFWATLGKYAPEQKRQFLFFVTGTDRVPVGGVEKLHFIIQRSGPDSDRLPTAHTCFNVLLLPEYSSCEKLENRLWLAISNAQGFGLR